MSFPKLLIIDASILFSFFKSDSVRRNLIEELLNHDCKIISPAFVFEELLKDKEKIMKFARVNELEFIFTFSLLKREIETFSKSEYERFLSKAEKISPHDKDIPYFALALKYNSLIWSDEKEFKQQSKVKIFFTEDLLKILEEYLFFL